MKRLVLTLILAATTLLGASVLAPAGIASAYPPGQSSGITTNVPSVGPGGPFVATVNDCLPGETVVITFQGTSVTTTCNSTTFQSSASFDAPTTPGTYQVCADLTGTGATVPSGVTRPRTICTTIVVQSAAPTTAAPTTAPTTTPGGGLPATGANGLGTTVTSAIILVAAGALLLIVTQARRRRTAA